MTDEMTAEQIGQLQLRVAHGIEWLVAHDPGSVFHLWFTAGLTPASEMPGQGEEVKGRWKDYYEKRVLWERLERKLAAVERRRTKQPPAEVAWQP